MVRFLRKSGLFMLVEDLALGFIKEESQCLWKQIRSLIFKIVI